MAAHSRHTESQERGSDISSDDLESSGDNSSEDEWDASTFLGVVLSSVPSCVGQTIF